MSLLDILASIPKAITEKARADEFGRDWKERRQRAADVHGQSELENAISTANFEKTNLDRAAQIKAAMQETGLEDPEAALAGITVGDRKLERRSKEAIAGYNEARPEMAAQALETRVQLANQADSTRRALAAADNEIDRARLEAQLAKIEAARGRAEYERGSYTWIMGPDGQMHYVNPKGNGGAGKEFKFEGETPKQPPTTDQRNRAAALGRSAPILSQIEALALGGVPDASGKTEAGGLNTGNAGPQARVGGYVTGAESFLNMNPKAAQYDSLVKGFLPMVARAVGHTGVLTQKDIDSVRLLFPNFGDSEEVARLKIDQVKEIMAKSGGGATPPGAPDAPPDETGDPAAEWLAKNGYPQ